MSFGDNKLNKFGGNDEDDDSDYDDDDDAVIDVKKKKKDMDMKVSWMDSYNKLLAYYQVSHFFRLKVGRSIYSILLFISIYCPGTLSNSRNINIVMCQGKKI